MMFKPLIVVLCLFKVRGAVIEKSVSVKTPERRTSLVDHFNPAGHSYSATGRVLLQKAAEEANRNPSENFLPLRNTPNFILVLNAPKEILEGSSGIMTGTRSNDESNTSFRGGSEKNSQFNLERIVSVKAPQIPSSVISHFVPAQHNYAATGKVVIDKSNSKSRVVQKSSLQLPRITTKTLAPDHTLENHIKSDVDPDVSPVPCRFSSSNNEKHNKKSSNEPVKEEDSQSTQTEPHVRISNKPVMKHPQIVRDASNKRTDFSRSQIDQSSIKSHLNLERRVSVKSPPKISSVIEHFTPAQHNYVANGHVFINKLSRSFTPLQRQNFESTAQRPLAKATFKNSLNIPGERIIRLTGPSVGSSAMNQLRNEIQQVDSDLPNFQQHFPSRSRHSQVNLEKMVSVKSPKIVSSVIEHFTPAQHNYAATGSVIINRSSHASLPSHVTRSQNDVRKAIPRISAANPIAEKSESRGAPLKLKGMHPILIKSSQISESKEKLSSINKEIFLPSPTANIINSGENLERKVSVKSPETISSVIAHFTPAQHNYAATGHVVINRLAQAASPIEKRIPPATKDIVGVTNAEKVVLSRAEVEEPRKVTEKSKEQDPPLESLKKNDKSSETAPSLKCFDSSLFISTKGKSDETSTKEEKEATQISQPSIPRDERPTSPKVTDQLDQRKLILGNVIKKIESNMASPKEDFAPTPRRVNSDLRLEKTVSVNVPEHRISPIDHFNPASHVYSATGSISISRSA